MGWLSMCLSLALGTIPLLSIDEAHRRTQTGDQVSGQPYVIEPGPGVRVDCLHCRFSDAQSRRPNAVMILDSTGTAFLAKWPDLKQSLLLDTRTLVSALGRRGRFAGFAAGDRWFLTIGHLGGDKKFGYDVAWAGEITVR
jgi:hypothetical protein